MANEELQKQELEQVSGGYTDDVGDTHTECWNCNTLFDRTLQEKKTIQQSSCHSFTVYKCPGCGHWVQHDGEVYD